MQIPLVDLKAQYASIQGEVNESLQNVLDDACFVLGPPVMRFEQNFAEFCLKLDPTQPSPSAQTLVRNGGNLEYTYTRAKAAVLDGVAFNVQWIDDITQTNWSGVGVSESILSDNGVVQQVKATLPAGPNGRRFVRLQMIGN